MKSRQLLRHRIENEGILVAPGAYDALSARMVAEAGFEAVYLTGSGVSYTSLAQPDLALVTEDAMWRKVWEIASAVELPIIADADTGYGGIVNVVKTVRDYERAGAAAIQFEDQVFPKRCGHYEGKHVVSTNEMVGKLKAALDARVDADLLIVARTDARAVNGLEDAISRGQAYAEAGADVVFVEAPRTEDEMRRITRDIGRPCLANMVEGGRTPLLSASQLATVGYRVAIFPNSLTRAFVFMARSLLNLLKEEGTTQPFFGQMVDFDELSRTVGLQNAIDLEAKYAPRAVAEVNMTQASR